MTATDLVPRFPVVPITRGHYESFYLTAHEPGTPHGFWIRYTVRKEPGRMPIGSLWFTRFAADGPWATKLSTDAVGAGPHGTGITIGSAVLHADAAIGAANEASGSSPCTVPSRRWRTCRTSGCIAPRCRRRRRPVTARP